MCGGGRRVVLLRVGGVLGFLFGNIDDIVEFCYGEIVELSKG